MLPFVTLAFFRWIAVAFSAQAENCLAVVTGDWVCFVCVACMMVPPQGVADSTPIRVCCLKACKAQYED